MIRRRSGFTMIEVIVLITVMTVLLAIALSVYAKYIDEARVTVATSVLDSARKALMDYHAGYKKYPVSINFTSCIDENGISVFTSGLCDDIQKYFYSIENYSISSTGYILTARARDNKHTLLTLTESKLTK